MPGQKKTTGKKRFPMWLRRSLAEDATGETRSILRRFHSVTVCEEARCPNKSECYARRTATFMIMGGRCTRDCRFCSVRHGRPQPLDQDEPERIAMAAAALGLKYVVVTSVTRDDLPDEGAGHFVRTVREIHRKIPGIPVEVLTPDFHNRQELIDEIVREGPAVYNHNLEVVRRLQKMIRPDADYERSLGVLKTVKRLNPGMKTKSGLMLGLGEKREEILEAARDLTDAGCEIVTLGQYLAPGDGYYPVLDFVAPQEFEKLAEEMKAMGIEEVFAGPYVRSSYHASEIYSNIHSTH